MRDVIGYEGIYSVTRDGRIFSHKRHRCPGGWLKLSKASHGYFYIRLCSGGICKHRYVHDLVASAFIGERPAGMQVRHLNGDGFDNRVENLAYGTQSDNEKDKVALGLTNRGARNGMSKLTDGDILKIKAMNIKQSDIAEMFGVHQSAISNIKNGKSWSFLNAS